MIFTWLYVDIRLTFHTLVLCNDIFPTLYIYSCLYVLLHIIFYDILNVFSCKSYSHVWDIYMCSALKSVKLLE